LTGVAEPSGRGQGGAKSGARKLRYEVKRLAAPARLGATSVNSGGGRRQRGHGGDPMPAALPGPQRPI